MNDSYAVNPLTGEKLDIDVVLNLSAEDIRAIYDYERWDYERAKDDLAMVLTICREIDRDRAIHRAVDEAIEYACVQMGLQDGDILSDENIWSLATMLSRKSHPSLSDSNLAKNLHPRICGPSLECSTIRRTQGVATAIDANFEMTTIW